jgi:hypothetical protein
MKIECPGHRVDAKYDGELRQEVSEEMDLAERVTASFASSVSKKREKKTFNNMFVFRVVDLSRLYLFFYRKMFDSTKE